MGRSSESQLGQEPGAGPACNSEAVQTTANIELTQSQREVGRGGREDSQVAAGRGGVLQGDDHLSKAKASSLRRQHGRTDDTRSGTDQTPRGGRECK